MIKSVLTIFILSTSWAFGQSLDECVDQASYIDPQLGVPEISENCKTVVANNAFANAIDYSSDNYIQAYAAGNILYTIQHTADSQGNPIVNVDGLSAGKFTSFNNIKALEIDEANEKIFLLDEEQDGNFSVVAVPANKVGSLAPSSKLFSQELDNAENLKLDSNNAELYVMGLNWIKVFNLNAYTGSFKAEHNDKVLRKIEGNNTALESVKDLTVTADKVYVLDGNRVLEFDRNNLESDQAPSNEFSVSNEASEIDHEAGKLIITLEDASKIEIIL